MIPKKPAPDLIRGESRFSEKIMPNRGQKPGLNDIREPTFHKGTRQRLVINCFVFVPALPHAACSLSIRMVWTALAITPAARFSPLGLPGIV
jgi:hypothetical protein